MEVLIFTDIAEDIGYAKYAGAYRVASSLRELGASVKVIDCFVRFTEEEILNCIKKYVDKETVFVGVASTLLHKGMNNPLHGFRDEFYAEIKSAIHSRSKDCHLIIGGSRIGTTTNIPGIDFYFIGKADISIQEYYKYLKGKENKFIDKVSQQLELNKDKYQEIKKQLDLLYQSFDRGESHPGVIIEEVILNEG